MSTQHPQKMQLLDPIGVGCKLILLHFLPEGTRLRIKNNVVELIPPDWGESLVWRKWNGDSREDMCLLFTSIIRFVELYLISEDENNEENSENDSIDKRENSLTNSETLECLKKLTEYITNGIPKLETVYGLTCAGLTLQYYINILNSGIDGTYTKKLLPSYAQDVINQNLIQPEKLKGVWKSEDIKRITDLFNNCFSTQNKNPIMLNGYITNIKSILSAKDTEFQKIVSGAF